MCIGSMQKGIPIPARQRLGSGSQGVGTLHLRCQRMVIDIHMFSPAFVEVGIINVCNFPESTVEIVIIESEKRISVGKQIHQRAVTILFGKEAKL